MGALTQPQGVLAQRSPQGILAKALNEPLPMEGRLTFLPAMVNNGQREFALPGILASAWNAFTAPGRAYSGNMADPVGEALNFAGMMQMGAMPSPAVGGPGTLGMNVYHGSPHKFDKFDMSKVGTGEGAQAYGHGLYFAENPQVAKGYQENLAFYRDSDPKKWLIEGRYSKATPEDSAAIMAAKFGKENALGKLQNLYEQSLKYTGAKGVEYQQNLKKQIDLISADKVKKAVENKGVLYKVDLPDEQIAKMLDWDKPLSQQKHLFENVGPHGDSFRFKDFLERLGIDAEKTTGGQFLQEIGMGRDSAKAAAISKTLKSYGIPGIRYLDGGSRAGGKGTSNFVVFDDSLPKIIGRE